MLKKKLLTIAGVLAILACGACFLPPLPSHEPPPPVRNRLDGVQNIRVEVTNASPSHHLDSADLARKVAEAINEKPWKTKIGAHVGKEAAGEDAVLFITVLSETEEPAPTAKTGRMAFLINDSVRLMRLDGALVWQESGEENWIPYNVDAGDEADAWKIHGLVDGVEKALSDRLVSRMFYLN
ncbi:MAG: hypothetical protein P4K93_03385 [Terracidiphilus sp.]|nr:hypothetical protein [Terracidiphilus sp.]MDR3797167.1 hypothetical protein [Terracidiphilus sp.]